MRLVDRACSYFAMRGPRHARSEVNPEERRLRAIFLDFDGVLHPSGGDPGRVLPFEWLPILANLLQEWPDVKLVVHSSWREVHSSDYLREFMGPLGSRFLGAVPPGPRGPAIQEFLRLQARVTSYIVLDDMPAEFPSDLEDSLIVCDPLSGISEQAVRDQIRRWLESTESKRASDR